jgi:hypothetical protein
VGIALLFAIARYGVPGARGSRTSAPPSGEASRGNSSESSAPSLRSAVLPAQPLAAPAGTSSRPASEPIASSLTAPDADSPREREAPAAVAEPDGEDAVDHFHPRYLRAEDVAQLREIDDPKSPPRPRAGRVNRRQPNWKTRFEKILRSATPAGATVREPRRIDEEDPYSP